MKHADVWRETGQFRDVGWHMAELNEYNRVLDLLDNHHTLLSAKDAEIGRVRARLEMLEDAVAFAAEIYCKPTGYRTAKGTWSPNMSIGFETRFERLCEKARCAFKEGT